MTTSDAAPFRTCPLCATNYGGLVDPACRFCGGAGVLALGELVDDEAPAIVARAVTLYVTEHGLNAGYWTPDRDEVAATIRARLVASRFLAGPADAAGLVGCGLLEVIDDGSMAAEKADHRAQLHLAEANTPGPGVARPVPTRSAAGRTAGRLLTRANLGERARPAGRIGATTVASDQGVEVQPADRDAAAHYVAEAASADELARRARIAGGAHLRAVPDPE